MERDRERGGGGERESLRDRDSSFTSCENSKLTLSRHKSIFICFHSRKLLLASCRRVLWPGQGDSEEAG